MAIWLPFLLNRRYRVQMMGDFVPSPGEGGPYIILPNHPSLVEPLLVYTRFSPLHPRPLVTASQARIFALSCSGADLIRIPDSFSREDVQLALQEAVNTLAAGHSIIMWPGERLQDNGREVLRGRSMVYRLLHMLLDRHLPLPELILVRTEGIWGSSFSRYATPGRTPGFLSTFFRHLPAALWGPLLPKRSVRMVLRRFPITDADCATMEKLNGQISLWYDAGPQAATLVPCYPWGKSVSVPASKRGDEEDFADVDIAPALSLLAAHVPVDGAGAATRLLEDLGIDSALLPQIRTDLKNATGRMPAAKDILTVGQLAQFMQRCVTQDSPVPTGLLREDDEPEDVRPVLEPRAELSAAIGKVAPALLRVPPLLPIQHAVTWQGTATDIALGRQFSRRSLMGLSKAIGGLLAAIPDKRIGIALPCGVGVMAAFLACLDCTDTEDGGRIPVLLDCNMPQEQLDACARQAGVRHVLTLNALEGRGLPSGTEAIYLDTISKGQLRRGYALSLWGLAGTTEIEDPAVMLFSFGHDGALKGISLSHRNLMSTLRALLRVIMGAPLHLHSISILCALPPSHPLGLIASVLLPLTCGVPVVMLDDPSDVSLLARACHDYETPFFAGTAAQLYAMLLAASGETLPLRWAMVTGEQIPPDLPALFHQICPDAVLIPEYGCTECSGIISLNVTHQSASVGRVLPHLEHTLEDGQLYVRGESVFNGYDGAGDPRVALPPLEDGTERGADWYPTGDFFEEDALGFLYLQKRQRRIAVRGEAVVSLSIMEKVLNDGSAVMEALDGRIVAVRPGIGAPRELNARLREQGYNTPWKVDATLDALVPLLADGNVDYEALRHLV